MADQIHTKFTTEQVKELLQKYIDGTVERKHLQEVLGIGKSRFFEIIQHYRRDPKEFSVDYKRSRPTRVIEQAIKDSIAKELAIDKKAIENKSIPLNRYNYSYVQRRLENNHKQTASLNAIIQYAKKNDFYLPKRPKAKAHDRVVLTTYPGELIQHDASYHMWSPDSRVKWCLITSLDDYSRFMLYAKFVEHESTIAHIEALQSVVTKYGTPLAYYTDCHSIFRYIKGRDQRHNHYEKFTDDVDPQWKQVVKECGIKPIYALSPQAKGKIERPYGWLQDHLIRNCLRDNVKDISHAQRILNWERDQYNYKRIHSTTRETPSRRFNSALEAKKSLFRTWTIPKPFLSYKDIFALRLERYIDNYCSVTIKNTSIKLSNVESRRPVDIRAYKLDDSLFELRFWHNAKLIKVLRIKAEDFLPVHF